MSGSPEEWYRSLPIITRGYLTGAFASTILCQLEFIAPQLLILDFGALIGNLEVWRLFTNFLFFGPFSMNFCFAMFFLVRYGRELEAKRFEGRAGDMLWMMMATGLVLVGLAYVMGDSPVLSQQMLSVLVYLWSRENSEQVLSIFGLFNVQAFYFPWVLCAIRVLMGGSPVPDLMGIFAGHVYYFVEDVQGVRLVAPQFLSLMLDTPDPAAQRARARQGVMGGHNWGGGGQRLGQ
mmetsp:Transcript_16095/g.39825  ORF Transcript_16095/g.39825 Transcript_16095/m.39825 type:complete len:235 (+) Transcript_16095:34-738(+)|eukprot:CAMPEP_0118828014 /NCGR_PEP_ID=MMETSP1162-20130426/16506_1 /TAXON_ID=33656 /ORGANISM="Phaeocystis Sp, Strain CCMP2710" /LENGTH=234 /DNA_ID=CAMNT_0006758927 /DNA_START=33 /DNA_END=737 /DNA_ORIENTATION=-